MASCDGCLISDKGKHEALINARKAARDEAVLRQRPIAIVFTENEYQLYDAFIAYEKKMPVTEVISHL